jgi:signal transduction histidine kinase
LWVGTDVGVAEVRDGKILTTLTRSAGLPGDKVLSLAVDSENRIWMAADGGIAALKDGHVATYDNRSARNVFVRNDGTVLAALADGSVVSLQGKAFHPLAAVASFGNACCFFDDADGNLWIGGRGTGLALLRSGQLTTLRTSDGLYDDDLYAIVPDNQGKFWFACSKGIFAVPRSQLLDFAAGKIKSVTSTTFSPTDGLRTVECKPGVSPAGARTADGMIWFSTIHGAIEVDSANIQRRGPPPDVLVEDVVIDGKSRAPSEVTELSPGTMNLEFGYTALSFLSPARTTFHYKLEGFDKDWVDAGNRREAFYTNLPPGKYRFRVVANVLDGASAEARQAVEFRLAPHFYQRAFFVPMLVAILIALVSFFYWRRIREIQMKNRAVLAERSRIARELHDTLMQGFSGVTMEMQAFSTRLEQPVQRKALDEIIRDAGTCLREARQSIAGLRTGTGPSSGLGASITLAARQAVEGHDVRLKLNVTAPPRPLAPEVDYNLLNIAKEAIANALKHSGCRNIDVRLETAGESLILIVKDGGSGITAPAGPGHYGMVGMKERAAQIGAKLEIESKPGRGTTVRATAALPVATAADATEGKLVVS